MTSAKGWRLVQTSNERIWRVKNIDFFSTDGCNDDPGPILINDGVPFSSGYIGTNEPSHAFKGFDSSYSYYWETAPLDESFEGMHYIGMRFDMEEEVRCIILKNRSFYKIDSLMVQAEVSIKGDRVEWVDVHSAEDLNRYGTMSVIQVAEMAAPTMAFRALAPHEMFLCILCLFLLIFIGFKGRKKIVTWFATQPRNAFDNSGQDQGEAAIAIQVSNPSPLHEQDYVEGSNRNSDISIDVEKETRRQFILESLVHKRVKTSDAANDIRFVVMEETELSGVNKRYGKALVLNISDKDEDAKIEILRSNIRTLRSSLNLRIHNDGMGALLYSINSCSICCEDYNKDDDVAMSNNHQCNHVFHTECILEWLYNNEECPLCRTNYCIHKHMSMTHDP